MAANALYRLIPSVNDVLLRPAVQELLNRYPRELVVDAARFVTRKVRADIHAGAGPGALIEGRVTTLDSDIAREIEQRLRCSLRKVINATGVILHTNLGRAPLSRTALSRLLAVTREYSNLELDLDSGRRGKRDVHAESLLLHVLAMKTGRSAEDILETTRAVVVNNCAAATFLALNSLAASREVIVSRSELVEIGGGFRIPEILHKSGAFLRDVGTTNRTHLHDYQSAITDQTGLILRVHQSNFKMQGFTKRASLSELIALGKKWNIPVFEDQGTGFIGKHPAKSGEIESSLIESFISGPDLIAASGDKLLGGPQCGILVGSRSLIEKIQRNPLMRALRVCKLTYSALEGTLLDYLSGRENAIPILQMIACSADEIRTRCEKIAASVGASGLRAEIVATKSVIGGGTTPGKRLKSYAVALEHLAMSPGELARVLRNSKTPIVGRVKEDRLLLDLRTVFPHSDAVLIRALRLV